MQALESMRRKRMIQSVYFERMPVDTDAAVIENRRLSSDYNVLSFDAPDLAATVRPGQFVMVKTSRGLDPLLRRPFSVFEVLRGADGRARGFSIFNKSIGTGTRLLSEIESGARLNVLGPLGRPFEPVDPPADAWMIAGGVGLAPFVTLAEALAARGTRATLFYGARRGEELHCVDLFEALGVRSVLATEDGSRGVRGRITAPLEEELRACPLGQPVKLYACGPTPMMRACADLARAHGRACDVSLEQVMGCGLGGCYSCVVMARTGEGAAPHHTRTCIEGPVFDASRIVWGSLAGH
jgi:dihydroorotate dehydrogenase electron transfer subunit